MTCPDCKVEDVNGYLSHRSNCPRRVRPLTRRQRLGDWVRARTYDVRYYLRPVDRGEILIALGGGLIAGFVLVLLLQWLEGR